MDEVWKKYFDPQVLESLRGLALRTRRTAGGTLVGSHRSPRHGQAVEFSEHRQYTLGDDLRQLDWKVLGRTDKYYLRQREDETSLDCHLMVDCSGSMRFQGPQSKEDKLTFAFRVTACLAFVAIENHDRASLITIGQRVEQPIGVGGGTGHLMALAAAMGRVTTDANDHVDVPVRWGEAIQGLARTGLVVLLSDLFDDLDNLRGVLRALRQMGREVIVVQIVDPSEEDFGFGDTIEYVGLEGEPPLVIESRGIAKAYRDEFQRHRLQLQAACLETETTFWALRSDEPLHVKLPMLLANR